jgi:hypothetical protein
MYIKSHITAFQCTHSVHSFGDLNPRLGTCVYLRLSLTVFHLILNRSVLAETDAAADVDINALRISVS